MYILYTYTHTHIYIYIYIYIYLCLIYTILSILTYSYHEILLGINIGDLHKNTSASTGLYLRHCPFIRLITTNDHIATVVVSCHWFLCIPK